MISVFPTRLLKAVEFLKGNQLTEAIAAIEAKLLSTWFPKSEAI
jgi:hypothetical protein